MKIKNIIKTLILLFIVSSCSNDDGIVPEGSLSSQHAVLQKLESGEAKDASFYNRVSISADEEEVDTTKKVQFLVSLINKENPNDVTVKLKIDPSQVEEYNKLNGTSYEVFPSDYVTHFSEELIIKAGGTISEEGDLEVRIDSKLKDNTPYLLAVTLSSISGEGIEIMESARTLFYTIEKVAGRINKVVKLTRETYFSIENSSYLYDLGTPYTMEGLIYVDYFRGPGDMGDAGITTFMGTEGQALMRFGDSGVPPNHLQANGQDIGYTFKEKQWYHIALVVDRGKTTAYVNGTKVITFSGSKTLGDFLIGKSYNGNRGLPGKLAEVRLWKTARSATDIKDNMYGVSPKTSGLYAYWKMNKVTDNKIIDVSENGKDLILLGQSNLSGRQNIELEGVDGVSVE